MKLTYANCFVPSGAHGDVLLTDEVAVAGGAPPGVEVKITDTLLDGNVAQELNVAIWQLAFNWFQVDGEDPSLADGISAADLAGSQVAIALLMPAARAALGVSAAIRDLTPDSFTTIVPDDGGDGYRAIETLQCDVADAVVRAATGGSVTCLRRASASPPNTVLSEKYAQTRDPSWLAPTSPVTYGRDVTAAGLINALAAIGGPRRKGSLLVYEYNPTHAFAEQYSRAPDRLRLARCNVPRADLLQVPRRHDRVLLPPRVGGPGTGPPSGSLERFATERHDLLSERFRLAGVDLWPLLRPRLLTMVARYQAFAAAAAPRWRRQLERDRIRAVLVPFDSPPEVRLLVRVAQQAGIPTYLLNDGFKADDFSMDGMTADHVLAWSEALADNYYSRRPGRRAEVTGNPKADVQRPVRPRPAMSSGPRRILIGSFTFSPVDLNCRRSDSEYFLEAVLAGIEASATARRAEVRIKLHPADRLGHYESVLARHGEPAIEIVAPGDVVDAFDTADLYITTYSTSLLEAVGRDVPVVYYRVNAQRLHPPFSGDPVLAARTAATPAELAKLLDDPLALELPPAPARAAWIERYLGPTDGRSTERIGHTIMRGLDAAQP